MPDMNTTVTKEEYDKGERPWNQQPQKKKAQKKPVKNVAS
jgi:hypothetical protein